MKRARWVVATTIILSVIYLLQSKNKQTTTRAQRPGFSFPYHGYLLIKDENEPGWYMVSIPTGVWKKVANGSFWTNADYDAISYKGQWFLKRVHGKSVDEINLLSGKVRQIPLSSNQVSTDTYTIGSRAIHWNGMDWSTILDARTRNLHYSNLHLAGPPAVYPYMISRWPNVLFVRLSTKDATISDNSVHDFVSVNMSTGSGSMALVMTKSVRDFIKDDRTGRLYVLYTNGLLETWAWSKPQFGIIEKHRLPIPLNEGYDRLIEIIDQKWMIYQTNSAESSYWGVVQGITRTQCYAYNLSDGAWSQLLILPKQHEGSSIIAWIPADKPMKRDTQ